MNTLVTGGAGYIGSHAVRMLLDHGDNVVVIDNLSKGHRAAVDPRAEFHKLDLSATDELSGLMRQHEIDRVLHFAAFAEVGESVGNPLLYFRNNTVGSLSLLTAMQQTGVRRIVFSSTCATYGTPQTMPIVEQTVQAPINPYGASKLFFERILLDHAATDPLFGFFAFRYFNVAGASESGKLGEDHRPESHLIPLTIFSALRRRPPLHILGTDYPTPDGTCIRDYVHVEDLCRAHLLALDQLKAGDRQFLNLGTGQGRSVREVIQAVSAVHGTDVPCEELPRRPGDPPELWADPAEARRLLDWIPRFTELEPMIETAYRWFVDNPRGYGD